MTDTSATSYTIFSDSKPANPLHQTPERIPTSHEPEENKSGDNRVHTKLSNDTSNKNQSRKHSIGRMENMLLDVGPIFNNQNTRIMATYDPKNERLILLHNTRIFFFKNAKDIENQDNRSINHRESINSKIDDKDLREKATDLIDIIIGILTTQKYRFLYSCYFLTKLFETMLLIISIIGLIYDTDGDLITTMKQYHPILIIFGFEFGLYMLESGTKIWIINRLSIYIHIIMYFGYYITYYLCNVFQKRYQLIYYSLNSRLGVFIISFLVNYCVDIELHCDLFGEKDQPRVRDFFPKIFSSCWNDKSDKSEKLIPIYDWIYDGSICAWTFFNIFKYKNTNIHEGCPCNLHKFFIFFTFIVTYFNGIVFLIIIGLLSIILSIIGYIVGFCINFCKCDEVDKGISCDDVICGEMLHVHTF